MIIYDGPTDDDADDLSGRDDQFGATVYVCTAEAFDLMAVAYAANPAVGGTPTPPFNIFLGLDNDNDGLPDDDTAVEVTNDAPYTDITVDNMIDPDDIVTPSVQGGAGLSDSTARVRFPANSLTLANDNEKVLSVCDPIFEVCDAFRMELVGKYYRSYRCLKEIL